MLKIELINFNIQKESEFKFKKMVEISEKMEKGEYPNIPDEFDYILKNDELEILETVYKVNEGFNNIYEHAKNELNQIQIDDKELKREKEKYMNMLDEEMTNFRIEKQERFKKEQLKENSIHKNMEAKQESRKGSLKDKINKDNLLTKKGIGGLAIVILAVVLMVYFFSTMNSNNSNAEQITPEKIYQNALLGKEDKAIAQYEKISKEQELSGKDKKIFTKLLIDNGKYDEAIKQKNEDYVENYLFENNKYDALNDFQNYHSTKNGEFDVAFHNKNYEKAIDVANGIDNTKKRNQNLAKAYVETDNLDKGKEIAASTDDESITKLISEKEQEKLSELEKDRDGLSKEVDKLKDKNKKSKKDKEKLEKLEKDLSSKKEEVKKYEEQTKGKIS